MAFGRKGLSTAAAAAAPAAAAPAAAAPPEPANVDAAIGYLSQTLGADLDFEIAYIFAPSLWTDERIAAELGAAGLAAEMGGNKMPLFRSAAFAEKLREAPADDRMKLAVLEAGFGLAPYDAGKSGGFDEGKTRFQHNELAKIAMSPASAFAKRAAVLNLFDWSCRLMKGEITVQMPG
jgi:hypothetical protein